VKRILALSATTASVLALTACGGSTPAPEGATATGTTLAFTETALLPLALGNDIVADVPEGVVIAEYQLQSLEDAPWKDLEVALEADDYVELVAEYDRAMYLRYTITVADDATIAAPDGMRVEEGEISVDQGTQLRIIFGIDTCVNELEVEFESQTLLAGTYNMCSIYLFGSDGGATEVQYEGVRMEGLDGYKNNPVTWTVS
jgi:hypothetical protein